MTRATLLLTIILGGGGFLLLGQGLRSQPHIQPPPAIARLCGNVAVRQEKKQDLFERMQAEGCERVEFVHIGDGWWLGYGVRVIVGETDGDS